MILLAARAGGLLFARAGQPAVIGEIAAGIALGPTLLGALPGDPSSELFPPGAVDVLELIGQLGLVLFMFSVGWDLDLRLVRRRGRAAAAVSIGSTLLPFALGLVLAVYLHPDHDVVAGEPVSFWPFALFVGASLALTAFPVLARILNESGLAATPLGTLTLTAAAADDLIGWSVLAVALAVLASSSVWDYVLHRPRERAVRRGRRVRGEAAPAQPAAQPVAGARGARAAGGVRGRVRDRGDRHPCGVRRLPRRHRDAAQGRSGRPRTAGPPAVGRHRGAGSDLLRDLGVGGRHPGTARERCRGVRSRPGRRLRREVPRRVRRRTRREGSEGATRSPSAS